MEMLGLAIIILMGLLVEENIVEEDGILCRIHLYHQNLEVEG